MGECEFRPLSLDHGGDGNRKVVLDVEVTGQKLLTYILVLLLILCALFVLREKKVSVLLMLMF